MLNQCIFVGDLIDVDIINNQIVVNVDGELVIGSFKQKSFPNFDKEPEGIVAIKCHYTTDNGFIVDRFSFMASENEES